MPRTADPALNARRRDEILAAASACFIANGFHQTNMQQICTSAKLSPGGLYRYFDSKTEIIRAIAEDQRAAYRRMVDAFAAGAPIVPTIMATAEAVIAEAAEPKARLTLEMLSEAGRDPAIGAAFRRQECDIRDALTAALETAQKAGAVTPHQPAGRIAGVILTLFDGATTRAASGAGQIDADALKAAITIMVAPSSVQRARAVNA